MSSLDFKPRPITGVVRGAWNNLNIGGTDSSTNSIAAYTHALQWSLAGKEDHAKKAIEILNAWSSTLESVSGHDAKLLVGMAGVGFCNAADLMFGQCQESGRDQAHTPMGIGFLGTACEIAWKCSNPES